MLNTPDEAIRYIEPFVPNDMALAKKALQKELPDSPDWIIDGILFLLANTIIASQLQQVLLDKVDKHWLKDTIPYIDLSEDININ